MSATELRSAIEAILFVSGEPVRAEDLYEAFNEEGAEAVDAQLAEITRRYEEDPGGFYLEQTAGGYRLATRPEFDPFLRKYFSRKSEGRLSMAALETLSIIAYRQPVTAPEISEIRGVNSSGVVRTLLERKLIRISGRKNVVGSPFLYRTSKEFLVHFGLNELQDLPRLEEFAEVLGENVNEELIGVDGDLPLSALSEGSLPADSHSSVEGATIEEEVSMSEQTGPSGEYDEEAAAGAEDAESEAADADDDVTTND